MELGYASRAELDPSSDAFGWATRLGVERLQEHLGVLQTGVLALGTVVFLPTAARVNDVRAVRGGPAGGAVLSATSTAREVSVDLDAGLQSQVKAGDRVSITLPDSRTTPGRVSSVGTVATARRRWLEARRPSPCDIALAQPAATRPPGPGAGGGGDHRPDRARCAGGAGDALLALAGGGYAVEVSRRRATTWWSYPRAVRRRARAWCRSPDRGWPPGSASWCRVMSAGVCESSR